MRQISGATADTAARLVRDAGIVYFNLDLDALEATDLEAAIVGATLLGQTDGGNSFNPGRTLRDMGGDGLLGPTMGFNRRESVAPTLTVNPREITADVVLKAIAGAVGEDTASVSEAYQKITGAEVAAASYIDNVSLVTYRYEAGAYTPAAIFVIENALAPDAPEFGTQDPGEMVLALTFRGHFDPANPGVEPWRIYHADTIAT